MKFDISDIISELRAHFNGEVSLEEVISYLKELHSEIPTNKYEYKVGDFVKIIKRNKCTYFGVVGSFDYRMTKDGYGPNESMRLKVAYVKFPSGKDLLVNSIAPGRGDISYLTKDEKKVLIEAISSDPHYKIWFKELCNEC